MTILIETQYFAPVSVFSMLKTSGGEICIEQWENYQKRSFRNKCLIATSNGIQSLIVPLQSGKNAKQSIKDVRIANVERWQAKHWQALRSAYGKSPYFEHYADLLQPFFTNHYHFLFDLNADILCTVSKCLKLQVTVHFTKTYNGIYENQSAILDCRNQFQVKKTLSSNPKYPQVFEDRHGFIPGLSILDMLFCMGPYAIKYL